MNGLEEWGPKIVRAIVQVWPVPVVSALGIAREWNALGIVRVRNALVPDAALSDTRPWRFWQPA